MRAAVLASGPAGVVVKDAPIRSPADGEVVLEMSLAAICGSDLKCIAGTPPSLRVGVAPGYPGHEGIGTVVESRHPELAAGSRVLACPTRPVMHGFAEYLTLPARYCVPIGDLRSPDDQLLMAQQLGTVVHAYRSADVRMDGVVLVIVGQGPAGRHFARLGRWLGAATVVVGDTVLGRLTGSGPTDVAVRTGAELRELADVVRELTDDHGADIVVDAAGGGVLEHLPQLVRDGGTIIAYGLPDQEGPMPFDHLGFFRRRARLVAVSGAQHDPSHLAFVEALGLIESGAVAVHDAVSHHVPLEEIGRGVELARDHRESTRKVVVQM